MYSSNVSVILPLKGFRCQLGDNFLTVYPNIQLSVKDTEDPETHAPIVATAEMLNAANGRSRLGCTVAANITEGGAGQGGNQGGGTTGGELE